MTSLNAGGPAALPPAALRGRSRAATAALVILLAGCAAVPTPRTEPAAGITPPERWLQAAPSSVRPDGAAALASPSAGAEPVAADPAETPAGAAPALPLASWWQSFGDPTLVALVGDALAHNPSLQASVAAWQQARALREVAQAGLSPTLDASGSAQRSRTRSLPTQNSLNLGLDASWELDLFGRLRATAAAADADAQASGADLGDAQVSIAAETALSYLALRAAELRLRIARDNLASQEETLQLVRWREQAGLASSVELQQAETSAEQTRAQVPALQQSAAQSLHALAVLTGRTPAALATRLGTDGSDTAFAGAGRPAGTAPGDAQGAAANEAAAPVPGDSGPAGEASAPSIPQPREDLALSLPAETLRQRPDVRAAEARVQAAALRVDQAEAARLPSFSLGGSIGLAAATASGLTAGGAVVSSLLGSVSLPLFDGGARRAQVDAQGAALDQARANHRGTVLAALQEVEDALVVLRRSRERLDALQRAATAADAAALLARQRYGSGLVDFQVVLDTQRTLLSAEDAVASARSDLATGHVQLYKALGGGWQPDAPMAATASAVDPQRAPGTAPTPPVAPTLR